MQENVPRADPTTSAPAKLPPARSRRRAVLAALALLVGAGAVFVAFRSRSPAEVAFEGKVMVAVRPVVKGETVSIDEEGALPVRAGGPMFLEVRYTQPAHTYLVWIDCQGKVVPLYPWNMDDKIEVEDLNQPPPPCMATKSLISPMTIGSGWIFGKGTGLETVLLLARRTPLGQDVRLGDLLGSLPPVPLRHPAELSILAMDADSPLRKTLVAQHRGTPEETRAVDGPLLALMEKLHKQFELIRVVRFAHADK